MSEPPDSPKATTDEFKRYLESLGKTFIEAEDHLGIVRGSLADTQHDSDYVAILKMASTIEPLINEILRTDIQRNFHRWKVEHEGADALATFVAKAERGRKLNLALELGLIGASRFDYAAATYAVRDRYAHNIKNFPLGIHAIAEKLSPKDSGLKILSHLSGVALREKPPRLAIALLLRPGLYHNFAGILSHALHLLKPPPLPHGPGLLGSLGWTSGENTPVALAASAAPVEETGQKNPEDTGSPRRARKKGKRWPTG